MARSLLLGTAAAAVLLVYGVCSARPAGPVPRAAPTPVPTPADLVSWETLTAYEWREGLTGLPDAVKALDGRQITLRGFAQPLWDWTDLREFSLVAHPVGCCFTPPPGITGQVLVLVADPRGFPFTDELLEVRGAFHARERREEGVLLSAYELVDATVRILR